MTTSTYDKLVVQETPTGSEIRGFVSGQTQARLVFTRRGEEIELLCMTQELACTQLVVIEALSGWELVAAHLVKFRRPHIPRHAAADPRPAADVRSAAPDEAKTEGSAAA